MHAQPVNAGVAPGRAGEAFAREPESLHTSPGTATAPAAHPTPTAFGRDPAHGNPEPSRPEHEYPGGYEHQQAPQAQGEHKSPPQPQNANRPAPQPAQPQNANRPAPPQNAGHPAPQPQNEHRNGPPPQNEHQGSAAAHAQGGDKPSHKPEAQSEHDAKHDPKGN
jgi:hypothetical protein